MPFTASRTRFSLEQSEDGSPGMIAVKLLPQFIKLPSLYMLMHSLSELNEQEE